MISIRDFKKLIAPIYRRVFLMLARGIVKAVYDANGLQKMQLAILSGETINGLERIQNYGMSSSPPVDSEAFVAFIAGNRDHGIVLAVDDRRIRFQSLAEGEVVIYTEDHGESGGHKIHLKQNQEIEIEGKKIDITINGNATIDATGDVSVKGANATVEATTLATVKGITVNVEGAAVNLGAAVGGAAVARVGDTVVGGIINSGSAIVKST